MFSAIVTGMIGLWGLSLVGLIDISLVYMLPTYLVPMAVGGLLFGVGMVIGGYCPGTAIAAVATGKIDGVVFIGGFLIGSMVFGDFFPVWGDFYNSDYMGAFRLDQLMGFGLGSTVLLMVIIAVVGTISMIFVQDFVWGEKNTIKKSRPFMKLQGALVAIALVIGVVFAFFPTESFIDDTVETPYYIVPKADMTGTAP
jgi:uncharacterized membrane protein YedE/YeeE